MEGGDGQENEMIPNITFSGQQGPVSSVSNYSSYLSIPNSNQSGVYVVVWVVLHS